MSYFSGQGKSIDYQTDQDMDAFEIDIDQTDHNDSPRESEQKTPTLHTAPENIRRAPPRIRMMLTTFSGRFSDVFDTFYYLRRREQRLPYQPEIALSMVRYLGQMYMDRRALPGFLALISQDPENRDYQLKINYAEKFKDFFPALALEQVEPLEIRTWIKPRAQQETSIFRIDENLGNVMILYQIGPRKKLMLNIHLLQDKYTRKPADYLWYFTTNTLIAAKVAVSKNPLLITTLSQMDPFFLKPGSIATSYGSKFIVPNPERKNLNQFEFFCRGMFVNFRHKRLSTDTDLEHQELRTDPDYLTLLELIEDLMKPFTQHPSLRIFRNSTEISREIAMRYLSISRFLEKYVTDTEALIAARNAPPALSPTGDEPTKQLVAPGNNL